MDFHDTWLLTKLRIFISFAASIRLMRRLKEALETLLPHITDKLTLTIGVLL